MDTHSMMNYANELYEKSKKGEKKGVEMMIFMNIKEEVKGSRQEVVQKVLKDVKEI